MFRIIPMKIVKEHVRGEELRMPEQLCERGLAFRYKIMVAATAFCFVWMASAAAQTSDMTTLSSIPHRQPVIPIKGSPQPGENLGHRGAANVSWTYPDAPADGLDAMRITMSPESYADSDQNFVYWAYDSRFMSGETYYMGLQPNGEFRKTALFSIFGPGTSSSNPNCKAGADNGAGTSCHIHYAWELHRNYQFTVVLLTKTANTTTWEGSVTDLVTQVRTVIGDITVPSSRGFLRPDYAVTFVELYKRSVPCSSQPGSEILFLRPFGYRDGQEYAGTLKALNINSGCAPVFYSDHKSYVYVDEGRQQEGAQ
jgi:hypothetical protein